MCAEKLTNKSDMNLPQALPCLLPPTIFALGVIYVSYILFFNKLNLCFFQTVLYSLQGLPLKSQMYRLVSDDTEHRWHRLRDIFEEMGPRMEILWHRVSNPAPGNCHEDGECWYAWWWPQHFLYILTWRTSTTLSEANVFLHWNWL